MARGKRLARAAGRFVVTRESDTVADGWRRLADDLAERAATTGTMPDGHRGELEKQLWMTTQLLTSPGGQWREPGGD